MHTLGSMDAQENPELGLAIRLLTTSSKPAGIR